MENIMSEVRTYTKKSRSPSRTSCHRRRRRWRWLALPLPFLVAHSVDEQPHMVHHRVHRNVQIDHLVVAVVCLIGIDAELS